MNTLRQTVGALALTGVALFTGFAGQGQSDALGPLAPAAGTDAGRSRGAVDTTVSAAVVASDYSSIFKTQAPSLTGSGWSACGGPITWSVDFGSLPIAQRPSATSNLTWALDQWSEASGLAFSFSGSQGLTYDDETFSVKPSDGSALAPRHIYLAFLNDGQTIRMGGATVGLGSPSQVLPSTKEITGGLAVFRTDHVEKASTNEDRSLFLHELGHVLGLAHASQEANVMYPMVRSKTTLGQGDINGVRTIEKRCTVPAVPASALPTTEAAAATPSPSPSPQSTVTAAPSTSEPTAPAGPTTAPSDSAAAPDATPTPTATPAAAPSTSPGI